MPFEKLRYGQLYNFLSSLGYDAQTASTYVVYRKVGRKLPVILPKSSKKEEVRSAHLTAVEQVLVLDGVIGPGQLASAMARSLSKQIIPKFKSPSLKNGKNLTSSPEGVKVRMSSPKPLKSQMSSAKTASPRRIAAIKALQDLESQTSSLKTAKIATPSRKAPAIKGLKVAK
jgi:hypothetical protein